MYTVGVYSGSHDVIMSFYRVYNHIQSPSGITTGHVTTCTLASYYAVLSLLYLSDGNFI